MADRRTVDDWLSDIVEWGTRAARHVADLSYDQFRDDEMAQDAVAKCVEAVGEAARRLIESAPDLGALLPAEELRKAYLTRNRLSHGYYEIDPQILWRTVRESLPPLVNSAREAAEMRQKDRA